MHLRSNYTVDYINRTLCDVLEEMRATYKTRNFASILGLIEEAQSMANRMESSLGDKADVKNWTKRRSELAKDIKKLEDKKEKLEESNE